MIKGLPKQIRKIITLVPVWGRHFILEQCIESLRNQTLPSTIILIVSCPDDIAFAIKHGLAYTIVDNKPLSKKFQRGYDCIKDLPIEAVVMCGSDDLLSKEWNATCYEKIRNGYDFVGKDQHYIQNMLDDKLYLLKYADEMPWMPRDLRKMYLVGSGRMIAKGILDKIGWKLYEDNKESGLDLNSTIILRRNGAKCCNLKEDCFIMSVKKDWAAINGIERMKENPNILLSPRFV